MLLDLLIPLLKHFGDTTRSFLSSEWRNMFLSVLGIMALGLVMLILVKLALIFFSFKNILDFDMMVI